MREIKRHRATPREREMIYLKYDKHCAYCGCEIHFNEMEIDHLIPVYHFEVKPELQGKNPDTYSNLMPSCRSCNRYKDTYDIETFRQVVSDIPTKLRRFHNIFGIGERYGLVTTNEKQVKFYFEECNEEKGAVFYD